MALKNIFWSGKKIQLTLLAIILGFVLLLVFIWLWYDLKLRTLDEQLGKPTSEQSKEIK